MDNPMSFDYVRQKLTLTTASGATSGEDEANDEDSWTATYSPTSPSGTLVARGRGGGVASAARRRPKSILKTKSKYDTAEQVSSPSSEARFYEDQSTQRD